MSTRVDMHVHSSASRSSRLGVQRALGLPECATPPDEIYELAKRRGMDFVTITDHDTIAGALKIADRPGAFVSEELTVGFAGEPQQVPRHRRRLAELFPIWEVRNGSRAPELNMPAAIYIDTHGGIGIGGSDDHAGIDGGRTWTEAPAAATPEQFLAHVRAGRVCAGGEQGSAAKWAHAAMALAVRALGRGDGGAAPDPVAVLRVIERVLTEGPARGR